MTGIRILSVVTLGSLHWTHAAGQGVVTDFVLVDSGSDAVWLRLPESVAGSPNGGPGSWQEFQLGGEAEMWSWSFDDEIVLEAHERGFVHVDLSGAEPQVKLDRIVLVDQDYRGDPLDLDIPPSDRESENTNRAPPVVEGELKLWHPVTVTFDGSYVTESSDPNPFLDYRLNVTLPRKARAFDRGAQPCQRAVLLSAGYPGHCACESYAVVEMIKVGGQLSTMPRND